MREKRKTAKNKSNKIWILVISNKDQIYYKFNQLHYYINFPNQVIYLYDLYIHKNYNIIKKRPLIY